MLRLDDPMSSQVGYGFSVNDHLMKRLLKHIRSKVGTTRKPAADPADRTCGSMIEGFSEGVLHVQGANYRLGPGTSPSSCEEQD